MSNIYFTPLGTFFSYEAFCRAIDEQKKNAGSGEAKAKPHNAKNDIPNCFRNKPFIKNVEYNGRTSKDRRMMFNVTMKCNCMILGTNISAHRQKCKTCNS